MKRILTLAAFFLAFGMMAQAQNSLEFSRVLVVDNNSVTVPAGKVWKITFIPEKIAATYVKFIESTGGTTGCSGSYHIDYETVTEEFPLSGGAFTINGSVNVPPAPNGVFWLPEGTTVACPTYQTPVQTTTATNRRYVLDGVSGCGPYTPAQVSYNAVLSVIEFNVN